MIRLNKFIAEAGVASRRKADEMIQAGLVKVNGKVVTKLGTQVDPKHDEVKCQGQVLHCAEQVIFMFNKPKGVTSTMSDQHATYVVADYFRKEGRVFPVGRLDKDSEGLLLITNNGELANKLTHPRYEHEKEYEVLIEGESDANINKFTKSYRLDGYKTKPMRVKILKKISLPHLTSPYQGEGKRGSWLISLILEEGRKRQIRHIATVLGYKVKQLRRVRIGKLKLGRLPVGKYARVLEKDII